MKKLLYASMFLLFSLVDAANPTASQIINRINNKNYAEAIKNIKELNDKEELNKKETWGGVNTTILIEAIKTATPFGPGNDELIDALMEKGNLIDLNLDNDVKTPLNIAIERNYLYAVKQLLDYGADVNLKNPLNENPPIYEAALNVAKQEVGKPASNDALNIMRAVLAKNPEKTDKFDEIIEYRPKKRQTGGVQTTFLIYAILDEKEELIQLLIEAGADINKIGGGGIYPETTPLLAAIDLNLPKIVEILLTNDANVDLPTDQGYPPVYVAAKNIDRRKERPAEYTVANDIMQMLLKKNPKKPTRFNENDKFYIGKVLQETTFLIYAIKEIPLFVPMPQPKKDLIELLLKIGSDPNQPGGKSHEETTPLIEAIKRRNKDLVSLLLDNGAKVSIKNPYSGDFPVHEAAKTGEVEILKILFNKGAKTDSRGYESKTPLMYAAVAKRKDAIEFLIGQGAKVNDKDSLGNTPLMLVAGGSIDENSATTMKVLLGKFNNINEVNASGDTALTIFLNKNVNEKNGNFIIMWGTEPEHIKAGLTVLLDYGAKTDHKGSKNESFDDIIKKFPDGELATWYKTYTPKPTPTPAKPTPTIETVDDLNKALNELSISLLALQQYI